MSIISTMLYGTLVACMWLTGAAPARAETTEPQMPLVQPKRQELVVRQLGAIEFGTFASDQGGGSITIHPSGTRISSGNISLLNTGFSGAAEFEVIGQPEAVVMISLPERVMLGRDGDGSNVAITSLTSLPADTLTLDANGRGRIKVGGTLRVSGNITPGAYGGSFDIDVRYQ